MEQDYIQSEVKLIDMSEYKHDYENNIKCPFCDHEWLDSWEFDENEGTHTCGSCDETFNVIRHIEVTYSTFRVSCEDQNKNHDFKFESAHCKKQEFISRGNWKDLLENEWTYFEKHTCVNCGEDKYNDITKEQYNTRIKS